MTARRVALAVVTLQSLLDLELIVLGGSIGVRPELYERVRRLFRASSHHPSRSPPASLAIARGSLARPGLRGGRCVRTCSLRSRE